jgi:hypothetical protein
VFALHPIWSGVVRTDRKAEKFREIPTYQEVVDTSKRLFGIEELFPHYEIRGQTPQGSDYALNASGTLVFERGCEIHLFPRHFTTEFHISTWSIEFSRAEVQRICKESEVAGSVTRDSVNSILVTLSHPNKELVQSLVTKLSDIVALRDGIIDTVADRWEWGTRERNDVLL